jgi:hypothetical protein
MHLAAKKQARLVATIFFDSYTKNKGFIWQWQGLVLH